jgi:predicted nucleic acid-binding Zn ribbon protein
VFEARQRISEPPLGACERCGGPVKRLLSPASFILKGEGWYVTDYPSEARKKAKKDESSSAGAASTATSGGTTSTESKSSTQASTPSPSSGSGGAPSSK